jgi:colanic acid biosynthesis glycosyl transferase WcaI
MASVLIYSLVFPPDGVSTAQLMGELALDLKRAGHELSIITAQPHYNVDSAAEAAQPIRKHRGGLLYESEFGGIRVFHTAMPRGRGSFLRRLRGWTGFHLIGFLTALRRVPAPDVIIVPSPLLTAGVVAWLITLLRGGCYVYNVQELYPDLAIQLGRLRNPALIGVMRRLERFVYDRAGAVTAISPGICARVVAGGVDRAKVRMIPNFVDLEQFAPQARDNAFAREHGLTGRFVVSYAGNIGNAQGLETLLDAAVLANEDDVCYALIGDGVLHEVLAAMIRERGLRNIIRIGHQPYTRVPEIYAASDVCLVPLLGTVKDSALPSKVLRIMASGRPILALCDPASELASLVRNAGAGVVVAPGDVRALHKAVCALRADPEGRAAMGRAGYTFAGMYYSRDAVTRRYSDLIQELETGRSAR